MPIANAGGNTLRAKLDLFWKSREWWKALKALLAEVDAVHIRCPNNISILGLLALVRSSCYRQAVYTGNWNGYDREPITYRWQRWFLRNLFSGPVAVYGDNEGQAENIISSFSPSFRAKDWEAEKDCIAKKIRSLQLSAPSARTVKLVSVGALNKNKNQQLAIRAVKTLKEMGLQAELSILGEGEMRGYLSELIDSLGLKEQVHLKGKTPHQQVRQYYRESDFVIQPSLTEGFSKVPVEALFHGAIPLLSDLSVNAQIVGRAERGRCFPQGDASAIAAQIFELASNPAEMTRLINSGREYARQLTLEAWREHIRASLEKHWRVHLSADNTASQSFSAS
jgi:glycosyltransferase involved in cell wall biosynthesis